MTGRALSGRTVLVTRAAEDAAPWARRLEELGARAIVLPCLACAPATDAGTATRLRTAVARADWLVVASRRGVRACANLLGDPLPSSLLVAAVGPATADEAVGRWGRLNLVAPKPTALDLAVLLAGRAARDAGREAVRVVVAGAAGGRRDVERVLGAAGAQVSRVDVYRTAPARASGVRRDLAAEGVSDVLLASPSAVTGLLRRAVVPPAARVITIGPTTTAAARAVGLSVVAEARRPDFDSLLEAMR